MKDQQQQLLDDYVRASIEIYSEKLKLYAYPNQARSALKRHLILTFGAHIDKTLNKLIV